MYKAQVTLNMVDGIAENAASNTWYVDSDTVLLLNDFTSELETFYQAFDQSLSSLIDASNVTVEYYRLSDPEPRSPVKTDTLSGLTVATTAAPTEVALVMSYQGEKVSGLPQSRRRGRVFLGPWAVGNYDSDGRVSPGFQTTVRNAGAALLAASIASAGWTWAQYSPTNGVGIDVASGWVDNEWDTQRRRGREATQRLTY